MAATAAENGHSSSWAGDLAAWRERTHHRIELPSGMRVVVRTVTLDELAAEDALPEDLLRVALAEVSTSAGAAGLIADQLRAGTDEGLEGAKKVASDLASLVRRLAVRALVEPKLTMDQLDGLPVEDLEMISGIATRRVGFDAAGRRVGVEPLDTFATFRDSHACPEGCAACEEARVALSTVHGG